VVGRLSGSRTRASARPGGSLTPSQPLAVSVGPDALAARSWYQKARKQFLDLRQEGKLAPNVEVLLTRVDEEIARLDKRSGG